MNRTEVIIGKIVRRLKALKVDPFPRTDELIALINDAQLEVAQRGLAIKSEIDFLTEAGEGVYDLGVKIFRIRKFIEPTSWKIPLQIFNNEDEWSSFVRSNSLESVAAQPLGVFVWNNRLKLFPVPTVTGDEVEVLAYLLPSRLIKESVEPEVDLTWDGCLEYSVLDQILGGEWRIRYDEELSRLGQQNLREILSSTHISHFSDIGF